MEIEKDKKYNEWLGLISASESTRNTYFTHMKSFCGCVGKTPTELIQESIQEVKQGLLPAERKTRGYIVKYKQYLSGKGLAPKSQASAIAALKSFYKCFDMPLSESVSKTKKAEILESNNVFIKREDIVKLITNAKNLRERAIILCMATSGMALGEIVNLKIKNIEFDGEGVATIRIRRQKAHTDYTTFISPEAVIALKNYFDERDRDPKTKVKGEEDYVFISYSTAHMGKQLNPRSLNKLFKILGTQLGYDNGDGFVKTRSHALRKYFASTLEDNGIPKPKIDFMIGHTVSELDKAYFNRNPNVLKELYIESLSHITFGKTTIEVRSLNTEDAKELEALKGKNQSLELKIQELANLVAGNDFQRPIRVIEDPTGLFKSKVQEIANAHEQIANERNEIDMLRSEVDGMYQQNQMLLKEMQSTKDFMKKLINAIPPEIIERVNKEVS